jgi:hypothetical protein
MDKRSVEIQKQKPKRVPLGRRNVMKLTGLKDEDLFHYHWFNDDGDRLYQCLEGGYEFVAKEGLEAGDQNVESARGTESTMKKGVGGGKVAYLMRIPLDIYKSDQANKQLEVDAMEADIRKPKPGLVGTIEFGVSDKP